MVVVTGPEQHAATVSHALNGIGAPGEDPFAALDELVALAGRADEWPEELHAQYLVVLDERDAAEARAHELQRERDRLQGVLLEVEHPFDASEYRHMFERAAHFESEAEQARREADQLRAAISNAAAFIDQGDIGAALSVLTQHDDALAGAQADKPHDFPTDYTGWRPLPVQADNKDSA